MAGDDRQQPFIVFGAPQIEQAEIDEVVACLRSGWLGTGPRVEQFEQAFAAYRRVAAAAATNSCTAALHLALIAAGIGPGMEVITTPLTFVSTVNVILHVGATPVLVDVDPVTMNIDPARIAEAITEKTRAILPVHFAGRPCDMDAIMALSERYGLAVIEDCAHALETEIDGRAAGSFGDFGCFSFYVTKNLTTGEGGMVVARDQEKLARVRRLSLHGLNRDAWKRFGASGYAHYQMTEPGYKYNMTDLQAAIGLQQLARIERNWGRRKELWEHYDAAFRDLPIEGPAAPAPGTRHAHHLYTIQVDERRSGMSREHFLEQMKTRGIGVGVHYQSIPEHPYFRDQFGWQVEEWPHAGRIGRQTVSLPLSAALDEEQARRVIEAVGGILAG